MLRVEKDPDGGWIARKKDGSIIGGEGWRWNSRSVARTVVIEADLFGPPKTSLTPPARVREEGEVMARSDLHADMVDAMVDVVLKRVESCIKCLRCDTSAIANDHLTGYESGFRAAKRMLLDILGEIEEP
jgi:hypothetical protein